MNQAASILRILLVLVIGLLVEPGGLLAEHEASVPGGGTPFTVPTGSLSPPDAFPLPHYHGPHPITFAPDPNPQGSGWGAGTPIPHLESPGPDFTMRTGSGSGTGYTPGADFDPTMGGTFVDVSDAIEELGRPLFLIDFVGYADTIREILDNSQKALDSALGESLADPALSGGSRVDFNAEPPPLTGNSIGAGPSVDPERPPGLTPIDKDPQFGKP